MIVFLTVLRVDDTDAEEPLSALFASALTSTLAAVTSFDFASFSAVVDIFTGSAGKALLHEMTV